MKKILIIGAGNIGIMIAYMLYNYDVTVADINKKSLKQKILENIDTLQIDVSDHTDHKRLIDILKHYDYVINAGPYFITNDLAFCAVNAKTHYFDLTEDIKQSVRVRTLAEEVKNEVAFVPQCGLAPGFISIVANHLAKQFDTVLDIKMRVGALPMFPDNALKYNMTWSTDGLINEYLHPCTAIKNGKLISVEPLEGYETFILDGDQYEAFNTSGGLGTLCETWADKVVSMNYKTVRYPGHCELMKFLINDMKLGEDNGKQLKQIMSNAIPITTQDVVLIFVTVTGHKEGRFVQETWTKKVYGRTMWKHNWSAIQLTTAAGICAMVELHHQEKLPQTGFIKQEDVEFEDFMATSSARIYN